MSGCLDLAPSASERKTAFFVGNEAGHCDVASPTRLETSSRHFCFSASISVWVPFA